MKNQELDITIGKDEALEDDKEEGCSSTNLVQNSKSLDCSFEQKMSSFIDSKKGVVMRSALTAEILLAKHQKQHAHGLNSVGSGRKFSLDLSQLDSISLKEDNELPRSSSMPTSLVSSMKGKGRLRPKELHVNWAPDVYDPLPSSASHTVGSPFFSQHRRSRTKSKDSRKGKHSSHKGSPHHSASNAHTKNHSQNSNSWKKGGRWGKDGGIKTGTNVSSIVSPKGKEHEESDSVLKDESNTLSPNSNDMEKMNMTSEEGEEKRRMFPSDLVEDMVEDLAKEGVKQESTNVDANSTSDLSAYKDNLEDCVDKPCNHDDQNDDQGWTKVSERRHRKNEFHNRDSKFTNISPDSKEKMTSSMWGSTLSFESDFVDINSGLTSSTAMNSFRWPLELNYENVNSFSYLPLPKHNPFNAGCEEKVNYQPTMLEGNPKTAIFCQI